MDKFWREFNLANDQNEIFIVNFNLLAIVNFDMFLGIFFLKLHKEKTFLTAYLW